MHEHLRDVLPYDEVWHFDAGDALVPLLIDFEGASRTRSLNRRPHKGQVLHTPASERETATDHWKSPQPEQAHAFAAGHSH